MHKFANDGLHNADDYAFSDFKNTLNQLFDEIGLNPAITTVNGFEFGVNIKLQTNPNNALNRLILHKSNQGNKSKDFIEFEYINHSIKFYNKSGLTKINTFKDDNILRVEVKVKKMNYIKQKGVCYTRLSDFSDITVWELLEKILIETIQECLFIDFTTNEINKLSNKNRIKYLEYSNPLYWERLFTDTRLNRNKYSRERAKCEMFINQYSKSTLRTDIINLISSKCKELRDIGKANGIVKKWDKITVSKTIKELKEWDKITIKINSNSVPTLIKHDTLCKGCGRIILNPRKGQLYCSAKVVGYKEAHKCRNSNSNIRNNTKRSIKRVLSIPLMFDLSETIAPNKQIYLR